MKYRAEIDGLRALAVIPVILFHAGFELFSGGFVGVDIFFVISGYLITTILIQDLENNRFSIFNFYERRARRILPALFIVSLFTIIAGWIILNPIELKNLGDALIGVATFTSNFVFWQAQGYFDETAELNPLLHTWSLAVEEQYYVLFPIFLITAWRFGKNSVFWMIVAFSAISLILSEWGWRNSPTANFYLAPTRAWELFAGSIAAFIVLKQGVRKNNFLSLLGLFAIIFSIFAYDETTPFPSVYALVPVLGVVLLILFAEKETFTARLLSTKFFVGVGLISYSAYLWHQPIFAYVRIILGSVEINFLVALGLVLVTFIFAYGSWRFVENPFRKSGFLSSQRLMLISFGTLLFIAGFGVASRHATSEFEIKLAQDLVDSNFVYFGNVDERKFVSARLSLPLIDIGTLVMGSSRMMQVSSDTLGEPLLNLSVSGASINDYVAFIGEARSKFNLNHVLIGADAWLFNSFGDNGRWKSVENLYEHWLKAIDPNRNVNAITNSYYSSNFDNDKNENFYNYFFREIYKKVNIYGSLIATNGNSEAKAKKQYDGFHIYDKNYISKTQSTIKQGFESLLDYNTSKFKYNYLAEKKLIDIINWLKKDNITVYFVLSPYHPSLYDRIVLEKPMIIEMENKFREIAKELGISVVGSYNPKVNGCIESDFYDGMHPKEACMRKVLTSIIQNDRIVQ